MAQIGSSREAKFPDGSSMTVETMTDDDTGQMTTTVYGSSGEIIKSGSPAEVSAYFENANKNVWPDKPNLITGSNNVIEIVNQQQESGKAVVAKQRAGTTAEQEDEQNQSEDDSSDSLQTSNSSKDNPSSGEPQQGASSFNSPSYRQHNPLTEFSSSTYKISLYSITPEAYNNYHNNGRWDKKDLYLLCQSGGILNTSDTKLESPRAKGFELDYFIDNLEIETATAGKESQGVSNQLNFKFQIFEPYGITFPTRIVQNQVRIQQLTNMKRTVSQQIEALQGHFLLVLRFYGYDENGNIVTSAKYNNGTYARTDEQAAFERAFPIIINKFSFNITNKVTVYDINAKLINEQISNGIKRGTVPVNVEITADTVGEALGGQPGSTTTTGLLDQLNKLQQDKVDSGKQDIADVYSIVFDEGSNLESSTLVDKNLNKDKAPMVKVNNVSGVNERTANSASAAVVKKKRTITFGNGIPIVQAVDQILSQSSYISDALAFKDDEEATQVSESDETYTKNDNPKTVAWYIVVPKTEIIDYDNLRNDYAYKITYVIKRYEIPYVRSLAIKYAPKYYGPHKRYNYWYTGQNTEVLSYEQQYNLLYFNASALGSDAAIANKKDSAPNAAMPSQNADPTSLMSGAFDAANSIKTFLYSPGDQLKAKLTIMGDPDFLMPATAGTVSEILKKWYGPDFTINPNSGQVFIEVVFNQVEDYGDNGLLTPNNNIIFWDYPNDLKTFIKGMVYMVTKVTSKFSKGKFTQELKTVIPNFSDMQVAGAASNSSNSKAATAGVNGRTSDNSVDRTTSAEDERMKEQNGTSTTDTSPRQLTVPAPKNAEDDSQSGSFKSVSSNLEGSEDTMREDIASTKILRF